MECGKKQPGNDTTACGARRAASGPFERFENMIPNALGVVEEAKRNGGKVAGIFCEYAPREIFFAAGVLPVVMCGGQESTVAEGEKELPSNLCPLIKSSYGHARLGSNPFMEAADLLVGETTCDGKKKMYELLARTRPVHVMELPQKHDSERAFRLWLDEVRFLKERVEELAGRSIDDASLQDAVERMNEERDLRRELSYLAAEDPPPLSGREILLARSSLSLVPCDLAAARNIIEWAKNRESPYGGRTRVLLTGVPCPHGAEKVMDVVEESGGVIVAQENCSGLKPVMENVSTNGDILENIARKYFDLPCSCMTPNTGRFDLLSRLIKDFRPAGIIDIVWQACHTYNVESALVRHEAENTWGVPYLKIETDYSPSDRAQLATRIEAFLEVCEARKSRGAARESVPE